MKDLSELQRFDRQVANLIDDTHGEELQDSLAALLDLIVAELGVITAFAVYDTSGPGQPREYTVFARTDPPPEPLRRELIDELRRDFIPRAKTSDGAALRELDFQADRDGKQVFALPLYVGARRTFYVGVLGVLTTGARSDDQKRLLAQAAARIDHHIFVNVRKNERVEVVKQIFNTINHKNFFDAIDEVLLLIMGLTRTRRGLIVYYHDRPPTADAAAVRVVLAEDGEICDGNTLESHLNPTLGDRMIAATPERIGRSQRLRDLLGITAPEQAQYFDLLYRNDPRGVPLGKLVLIGSANLTRFNHDIAQFVAGAIGARIHAYHERKVDLERSLHADQVEFFIRHPALFQLAFDQPREREITMVFVDLSGFTSLTRKLDAPDKVIERVRRWIMDERERIATHDGYFDKEIGDGVISLFGPPFYGIPDVELERLDGLDRAQATAKLNELFDTGAKPAYYHAYNAVAYALASQKAIRAFAAEQGLDLKLSIGIEAGPVAVGDTTGRLGVLTAIGPEMNLAARLQAHAEPGEIVIGSRCRALLQEYENEYLTELAFAIEGPLSAELKGCGTVEYFKVCARAR